MVISDICARNKAYCATSWQLVQNLALAYCGWGKIKTGVQQIESTKNSEDILVQQNKITVTDLVSAFWQEFVAWKPHQLHLLIHPNR